MALLMPGTVAAAEDHAVRLTDWKYRVAMTFLAIAGLVFGGGMLAFFTVYNPPPGSP